VTDVAQMTSGRVLRETRERKGYDLTTVARRLRIRPDILRAIEANDFSSMPPRGYTRNMVNAYARLLGLNPTEIVNMYLDEAYAKQVERARDNGPSSGFHMERETRRSRSRVGIGSGAVEDRLDETGVTQYTRRLYDDSTRFSRDDYGITRERTNKAGRSDRDFSSHHSGYSTNQFNFIENSPSRRSGKNIYAGQTGMQYTPSRMPGFLQSKGIIIAIAIIVLIIIIALFVVLTGGKETTTGSSTPNITGMPNTATELVGSSSAEATEAAPTSVPVVYTVGKNGSCYIVTINDGKRSEEELQANSERKVDVTGTFVIATPSDPENLTVTVDGQAVELKPSTEYDGMYAYEVEFATYLEKWRQTHSSRDAKRQAAVAEAGNTTPESSSSSSASAATESETQQQVSEEGNVYGQSYGETQYYTEDYVDYTNTNANSGYTGQTY